MLNHKDVHYLAAVLTQISSPWGVEIMLGERVPDVSTGTSRDVDITMKFQLLDGTQVEMHGIEVKDEKKPLDTQLVEGIIQKLRDMPSLTKQGLVSASGFTAPARKKAKYHGLELYRFEDWDGTKLGVDFSHLRRPPLMIDRQWEKISQRPIVKGPPPPGCEETFPITSDPEYWEEANPAKRFKLSDLIDHACRTILNGITIDEEVPQELNLPLKQRVLLQNEVKLDVNGRTETLTHLDIEGIAHIKIFEPKHAYKALVKDSDGTPLAGCLIQELPNGALFLFLTSNTDGALLGRMISVEQRKKGSIYKQALAPIPLEGPSSFADAQ